jgi:formate C-acetyltransferase
MKWWLLKHSEDGILVSPLLAAVYEGQQRGIMLCIGGVDERGNDVTNELTYMLMDAYIALKSLNEPQLTMRVHPRTPKGVISKAFEMIKLGLGYPSFFNDTALIPLAQRYGLPVEDARSYMTIFCVTQSLPNKNVCLGWAGWLNWAKALLWALSQGVDPHTGEQRGARTKDPRQWSGYGDMMEAYLEQLRFFGDKNVALHNLIQQNNKVWMGKPFSSAFCEGSLERGLMGQEWGYPYPMCNTWPLVGPINVANSMAAIRKWVFEEKKVEMADLIDALRMNWESYEEMRQLMLSAPKFGNDDDEVDLIANEIQVKSTAVMESFNDYWGATMTPNGSNSSTIYAFGLVTGATPDGRFNGDMLADGTISPQLGTDKEGPLAVLRSASKIDAKNTYCHLLNQRLSPDLLEGEVGQEAFYSYIKTWIEMGIPHIQFNVIDRKTLLDAQAHPDRYEDLLVRVAGYSAYFVDLNRGMQDGIIARTEHCGW